MDICHLYDYEHQARRAAWEYVEHNRKNIKRVLFDIANSMIWTEDGNTHHFVSNYRYSEWSIGRIYMLSNGIVMRSGHPCAEIVKGAEE